MHEARHFCAIWHHIAGLQNCWVWSLVPKVDETYIFELSGSSPFNRIQNYFASGLPFIRSLQTKYTISPKSPVKLRSNSFTGEFCLLLVWAEVVKILRHICEVHFFKVSFHMRYNFRSMFNFGMCGLNTRHNRPLLYLESLPVNPSFGCQVCFFALVSTCTWYTDSCVIVQVLVKIIMLSFYRSIFVRASSGL